MRQGLDNLGLALRFVLTCQLCLPQLRGVPPERVQGARHGSHLVRTVAEGDGLVELPGRYLVH